MFSHDEIIFNDENIKTTTVENLFKPDQKILQSFQIIVNEYQIKKISDYSREIKISDDEPDDDIQDIYIKLLNFVWDYVFSKNQKKFEELKEDKDFILETKNVAEGASANIILKIDVNKKYIEIEQDIAIKDGTIYLSESIDERKKVSEIAKYISNKIDIEFEKIERYYDKIYKYQEYTKDEYYKEESLEEAKGDDSFDIVFEKLLIASAEDPIHTLDDGEEEPNVEDEFDENTNEDDQNDIPDNIEDKAKNASIYTQTKKDNNNNEPVRPSINNDKVICPECNVEVNKKNLKKHLCKVHHQNCEDSVYKSTNNQSSNSSPDLASAIGRHEQNVGKKDENINPDIVENEEEYRKQAQNQYDENLRKSNNLTKKHYASRKVKVGQEETKEFLKKQYNGYCQICGFTFDQKNFKGKYFEVFDWLSEKISQQKTNIIDAGSSLCLCSRCHSGLKYGDFEANFLSKLDNIDLSSFTFDDFTEKTNTIVEEDKIPKCYDFIEMDMYKISIRLLHKEENIYFTEEHFLHFYNLLTIWSYLHE